MVFGTDKISFYRTEIKTKNIVKFMTAFVEKGQELVFGTDKVSFNRTEIETKNIVKSRQCNKIIK